MNFLDKLYESNYFGIGLFAVISFLVVTFLIVLFFGKRDEKKRRLESTKELESINGENAFKETTEPTPVEVSKPLGGMVNEPAIMVDANIPQQPVAPIVNEPVAPINYSQDIITPVAPINYDYEPKHFVETPKEEVAPVLEPTIPVIEETPTPIVTEPVRNVEPIRLEPTTYDIPAEPKVIEPIRITIPEETETPEEVKPIETASIFATEKPTVVEPVVNDTYYNPIPKIEKEEVEVPSIDFDALAKSISEELDELENTANKQEEVKVTPIEQVVSKPVTQFSSVYVNEPVKPVVNSGVELPKKIDLPTMKTNEIEPENYNL